MELTLIGEIFPGSGDAGDVGLTAELAFGAGPLERRGSDFSGEAVELVDHGVEGFFELEDFAADVDGDLAGKIGHSRWRWRLGNVTDLAGEVRGMKLTLSVVEDPSRFGDAGTWPGRRNGLRYELRGRRG